MDNHRKSASEKGTAEFASVSETGRLSRSANRQPVAVGGLFVLAWIAALYFARAVILPVALAVLLTLLLRPVIRVLSRIHIRPALGSAMVVAVLLGGTGYGVSQLADPATDWITKAPDTFHRMEDKLRTLLWPAGQINKVASQVEKLATEGDEEKPQKVEVKSNGLTGVLFSWTKSVVAEAALTVVLLYFLLSSEAFLTRKLVGVLSREEDKTRAVEITSAVEHSMSRYLFTVTMINIGLGVVTGLAMFLLGMPNPGLWGVMAALMPFIPYLGAMVGVVVLTAVAFTVFESSGQAMVPPLIYAALACLEGGFVTPAILGRRLVLNPVAILLSLMFWGWLWGIIGAILAVPLLTTLKIVCDQTESLSHWGELLGRD